MTRTTLIFASLLAICASPAFAQVIVTARPVVSYYAPAPVVTYSPTVYSSPVVAPTVVASPVVAAPVVVSRPVTTYYAPAPVTTYYAPTTTYSVPTTTYAPVTTPVVVGRPVVLGRSVYGTLTPYVPGQPVRNALRFTLP